jgi:hypothetical protein
VTPPRAAPAAPEPTPHSEETSEPRRIRTQIEQPSQANPGGRIEEGWYTVQSGVLQVEDMQGNILARQPVGSGDNVEALARKLLRR